MKKKSHYLCSLLLLITTILLTPFSGAMAKETLDFELDQVVITATKTPVKLSEAGANVSVVTKEEIEKMHYRNIPDILRHTNGINVADYGYPGAKTTIYLNGSNRVLVLVDGRRMNLPDYNGIDLINLVGADNVERIEVMKGAGSALYGSDAIGGVINIITRQGLENKTTISLATGSFGRKSYGVTTSGKEKDISWFFTYKDEHSDDFKVGDSKYYQDKYGEKREYSAYDGKSYTLRMDKELNDKDYLTFTYQGYSNEKQFPGSYYGWGATWGNDSTHSLDLTYTSQLSDKSTGKLKLFENNSHNYGGPRNGPANYDSKIKVKGLEYQVTSQINPQHLLTTGLEWRKDELDNTGIDNKHQDTVNKALYLQDQWKVSDKLSLTSGVRFDDHEQYGKNTTPRFLLNYQANEKTNYYASWAKFFRAPTFIDLYYAPPYGNPNLKPEEGRSTEFGFNHKFDKTLTGTVNYFTRQVNDAIILDSMWVPQNAARQKARGLEMELSKQFTPYFSTSVGYSYLSVKNDNEDGKGYLKDTNVPEQTWTLKADYRQDDWSLDLVGKGINNKPGKVAGAYPESSYWIWDTSFNYKFNKDTKGFITVKNLFNKYYAEFTSVTPDPWSMAEDYYPNAGRSYLFGVDYSF